MTNAATKPVTSFDLDSVRRDFAILDQEVNGKPLVYLDNAATTQKPMSVIESINHYYRNDNSNVHRGAHTLSDRATAAFENARTTMQRFVNAAKREEIIWSRGTTESINMVTQAFARDILQSGDEVIISALEHHSNIVPWQIVCQQTGAELKIVPVFEDGELDQAAYLELLNEKTRFVSIGHISNALGTINPVADMIKAAHQVDAYFVIDGAQGAPHQVIDVQALDCDFYALSGHKMFGPTGIGILYGKEHLLEKMSPYQAGGEMIETVSYTSSTFNQLPYKFEAGTPNIAGAVGLGAAADYLNQFDRHQLTQHEDHLLDLATQLAADFDGMRLVGTAKQKTSVMSFLLEGAHPHDVGTLVDQQGVAVRTGHHCTMPLMDRLAVPGTVRASFSFYNTEHDVHRLFEALAKAKMFLM